jgi:hypothetical protein
MISCHDSNGVRYHVGARPIYGRSCSGAPLFLGYKGVFVNLWNGRPHQSQNVFANPVAAVENALHTITLMYHQAV